MRLKIGILIAIAMIGLGVSGCPALMVGRLAYKGYQKDHESPTPTPSPGADTGSPTNTQ